MGAPAPPDVFARGPKTAPPPSPGTVCRTGRELSGRVSDKRARAKLAPEIKIANTKQKCQQSPRTPSAP